MRGERRSARYREVIMAKTTTSIMRDRIAGFNGREFRAADFSDIINSYGHLRKLAKRGEIRITRTEPTPGAQNKPRNVYIEGQLLGPFGIPREPSYKAAMSPWAEVWPEFFNPPALEGTSRFHEEWE